MAIAGVIGGVTFICGTAATQAIAYLLRISAAPSLMRHGFGLAGVAASVLAAGQTVPISFNYMLGKPWQPTSIGVDVAVRDMLFGLICFRALGGLPKSPLPSDLRYPGAFSRHSLAATNAYADIEERGSIKGIAQVLGCHSCGLRNGPFHADHMPPNYVAKSLDAQFLRKLFRIKTKQRYYPQCRPCSNLQSTAVKTDTRILRTHFAVLRPYHATGVFVGMFSSVTAPSLTAKR
eukprot:GILJ01010845.1.p1 GENE.GILJ01010845.1~~GILJ01010845.1.p1  ORF type:complete len:268 (+),score=19.21 GILJ01010845.1:103-804(+)